MRVLLIKQLVSAQSSLPRALLGRTFVCAMTQRYTSQFSTPGAGVMRGGGSGGSIRESGGAFGEREAALEEMYFREQEMLKRHKHKLETLKQIASQLKWANQVRLNLNQSEALKRQTVWSRWIMMILFRNLIVVILACFVDFFVLETAAYIMYTCILCIHVYYVCMYIMYTCILCIHVYYVYIILCIHVYYEYGYDSW